MTLKYVLDTLDGVDEKLKSEYTEKDGKFYLSLDDFEDPEPIKRNLTTARRKEREAEQKAAELAKKVAKFEKYGSDEEIEALIAEIESNKQKELEHKGQWEELKKQLLEKQQQEIKRWEGLTDAEKQKAGKLRGQIERYLVDSVATGAITAAKGVPKLLLPIVKKYIKVTEGEDGEFTTSIIDDKGTPRYDVKGEPLKIDELIAEMKASEELGRAFDGSGHSGSGAQPGGDRGPANKNNPPAGIPKTWAEAKSHEDKAKYLQWQKTLQPAKGAA